MTVEPELKPENFRVRREYGKWVCVFYTAEMNRCAAVGPFDNATDVETYGKTMGLRNGDHKTQ